MDTANLTRYFQLFLAKKLRMFYDIYVGLCDQKPEFGSFSKRILYLTMSANTIFMTGIFSVGGF